MIAVRVPGRATSEMLFSRVLLFSIVQVTERTSSPPVPVAAVSVRRTRLPSENTRSTLPMVTTSPSLSSAVVTRSPLTNVPLMDRLSAISVPPGVGIKVAWWRDANTSGITMSLSVARPTLSAPGGTSAEDPGRRILSMDVARADPEPPRAGDGPIWVGAASSDRAGAGVGARGRVGAGVGWVGGRVGGRVG